MNREKLCFDCEHFRHGTATMRHQCNLLRVSCSFARQTHDPYGCGPRGRHFKLSAPIRHEIRCHLAQQINAATEGERMMRAAIEEYEAKGFTVRRIGDEITVTGGPKR